MMSTRISGFGSNLSFQLGTPGNPTEVQAITTVVIAISTPAHTTITDGITVEATGNKMKIHNCGIASP